MGLTLRVVGLGYNLTFDVDPSATVGDVKAQVETLSSPTLPAAYQRLIARGKKLDYDEATLADLGIQHRTRLMLLHNESYASDREAFDVITSIQKEIDDLSAKADETSPEVLHELATQLCCKLDGVDTHGSDILRDLRRRAIEKADAIGRSRSDKEE